MCNKCGYTGKQFYQSYNDIVEVKCDCVELDEYYQLEEEAMYKDYMMYMESSWQC